MLSETSNVFVRRLDTIRLCMWGKKLNLLSRLSVVERGLLVCASLRRGIAKFTNAKLVRLLQPIMAKLEQWITFARKVRILAQNARKHRCMSEGLVKRNPRSGSLRGPLAGVIQKEGYVPGDYALGDAGLPMVRQKGSDGKDEWVAGEALALYRRLKHGMLPLLATQMWSLT